MIELRQDPLSGDWVSLNANRQSRPLTQLHDACPFCPGPHAEVGDQLFDVAVFDNRYPSFHNPGNAEVVVYSPRHHDDLAYLPKDHVQLVWNVWAERIKALEEEPGTASVFVFENRGQKVGATIAHPHGQIYAYPYIPPRLVKELPHFVDACPLCDVRAENPLLFNGQYWRLEVPYAMRMPYEVRLVPQRHMASFVDLSEQERQEGARLMQSLIRAYDRFFGFRTALVMALYQRPTPPVPYHFRWEFFPIDRGGGKIKYLAGSELAMEAFVVDMVPEQVQERLQPFLDREIAKGETNG
ncbi:hypothetical protein BXT84_03265 [Sulfobacillus thermotolerans]|uniref:Galactose-1-phosphate uridylyltransferase n=1 Tax=Sulfobacillus thermotolerans TaxID=338644 RepID=A0ABM6RNZ0_9FIRM|nr:hypothetical protein BXT84_03265 [Sulfobacillus thermotolerans]